MGLDEYSSIGYGWYNGRNAITYINAGYDREKAREDALAYIRDRLKMFRNGAGASPLYFYKEKLLSQWDDPTMCCFDETKSHLPGALSLITETTDQGGVYAPAVRAVLNEYQLLLYLGILIYSLHLAWRENRVCFFLPLIAVMGGILFSLLWEALGRYVFPYVMYMVPFAAIGWGELFQKILRYFGRCLDAPRDRVKRIFAFRQLP